MIAAGGASGGIQAGHGNERLLLTGTAVAVAGGAFIAASRASLPSVAIAALLAAMPLALAIVRDWRRALLGVVVLDSLLQWDVNFGYQHAAGALGAEAGLNVSLTTFALGGLLVLWLADRSRPVPRSLRPSVGPAWPLIAYITACAISLAAADDRALALFALAMLLQTAALFAYVAATLRSRGDVLGLIDMLMAALALQSLLILCIHLTGASFDVLGLSTGLAPGAAGTQVMGDHRATGTLGSPNAAAGVLELLLPVALAVVITPVRSRTRRLAAAGLVLGAPALIATGSRGGWVAFAVAGAILAVIANRRKFVPPRKLLALAVLGCVLAAPVAGPAVGRLTSGDEGSAASRVTLARLSLDMIDDHPFLGVGLNNFAVNIPAYAGPAFTRQWVYTVHNKYLLVWTESGPAALAAFVWFLGWILLAGLRATRSRDRTVAALAAGITAAIAGSTLHMAVDIFTNRAGVQLLWLLGAIAVALAALERRSPRTGRHG